MPRFDAPSGAQLTARRSSPDHPALADALDVFKALLAAGPVLAADVLRQGGIPPMPATTLRRAKRRLGVLSSSSPKAIAPAASGPGRGRSATSSAALAGFVRAAPRDAHALPRSCPRRATPSPSRLFNFPPAPSALLCSAGWRINGLETRGGVYSVALTDDTEREFAREHVLPVDEAQV